MTEPPEVAAALIKWGNPPLFADIDHARSWLRVFAQADEMYGAVMLDNIAEALVRLQHRSAAA